MWKKLLENTGWKKELPSNCGAPLEAIIYFALEVSRPSVQGWVTWLLKYPSERGPGARRTGRVGYRIAWRHAGQHAQNSLKGTLFPPERLTSDTPRRWKGHQAVCTPQWNKSCHYQESLHVTLTEVEKISSVVENFCMTVLEILGQYPESSIQVIQVLESSLDIVWLKKNLTEAKWS